MTPRENKADKIFVADEYFHLKAISIAETITYFSRKSLAKKKKKKSLKLILTPPLATCQTKYFKINILPPSFSTQDFQRSHGGKTLYLI